MKRMSSRQYAAIRRRKSERENELEARDNERAAVHIAALLGLCPDCGADRPDAREDHKCVELA